MWNQEPEVLNHESKMLKVMMINIMNRLTKQGFQHNWDISKNAYIIPWCSYIVKFGNVLSQKITRFGQKAFKKLEPITTINSKDFK